MQPLHRYQPRQRRFDPAELSARAGTGVAGPDRCRLPLRTGTMLQLDNRTPYAAERTIVMDKAGVKSWVVAVKATFDLAPSGAIALADVQQPVLYSPEHRGEPGKSSIRYNADLIPSKRATDVMVNGHAHAPAGRAAQSVDVSLQVESVRKRLRVFGDRHWGLGFPGFLKPSSATRFERMPITYERAFGGWDQTDPDPARQRLDPRNPIGSGFATEEWHLEGRALPNVELPGLLISSWNDRPPPAGFGAIASYWSPRLEWAGTYGDDWMKRKFPLLPDDFDDRFHQCAAGSADRRVPAWRRGSRAREPQRIGPVAVLPAEDLLGVCDSLRQEQGGAPRVAADRRHRARRVAPRDGVADESLVSPHAR